MGQAIPLGNDYTADQLRRLARQTKDVAQARRLLAIAAVLDGASRAEAARIGGMDRQTLRDWVIRFNAHGPEGLINITSPGVPPVNTIAPSTSSCVNGRGMWVEIYASSCS